jgi:hypothetical protein
VGPVAPRLTGELLRVTRLSPDLSEAQQGTLRVIVPRLNAPAEALVTSLVVQPFGHALRDRRADRTADAAQGEFADSCVFLALVCRLGHPLMRSGRTGAEGRRQRRSLSRRFLDDRVAWQRIAKSLVVRYCGETGARAMDDGLMQSCAADSFFGHLALSTPQTSAESPPHRACA